MKAQINFSKRLKNPQYWFMLLIAIITPIVSYLGLTISDIVSWNVLMNMLHEAIMNPYLLVLVIVNIYNATIDPTTDGISDSDAVMNNKTSDELLAEIEELKALLIAKEQPDNNNDDDDILW